MLGSLEVSSLNAYVGIIGAIAGAITTGLINYFLYRSQLNHDYEWQKAQLVNAKLEEIAKAANTLNSEISSLYMYLCKCIDTGTDPGTSNDVVITYQKSALISNHLKIVVSFYCQTLMKQYEKTEQSSKDFFKFLVTPTFVCKFTNERYKEVFVDSVYKAYRSLIDDIMKLSNECVECSSKLIAPK